MWTRKDSEKFMNNIEVLIKPDETVQDTIAELCEEYGFQPNEPFAFSAIMVKDKKDPEYKNLKINCLDKGNPYTPVSLITKIYTATPNRSGVQYVQPPLEQWLQLFKPAMSALITSVHPKYEKLIPDRDDMEGILYYVITKLYKANYYLHKTLIKRAYINELNLECRKLKGGNITDSLDATIGQDDDGKDITLLDQIADTESIEWAKRCNEYTDDDYWEDVCEQLKRAMIKDMGEFQFNRLLVQLKTRTIDRKASYWLNKYRDVFNPGYVPRPNAKGKPKGGK